MECHELELILEQQEAAALPAAASAHVEECEGCRALIADLAAIETVAREMDSEVTPPERVWTALRVELENEGLIRTPVGAGRGLRWLTGWVGVLPRPVLASASVALLLVAAILFSLPTSQKSNNELTAVQAQSPQAVLDAQLSADEKRVVSGIHQHNPEVVATMRENLAIVDNLIAVCEKDLRKDPQNQTTRDSLYGAYQQKADLLTMMMDRNVSGD